MPWNIWPVSYWTKLQYKKESFKVLLENYILVYNGSWKSMKQFG